MAKKSVVPRKRRTREHVIADLSAHYVEGFVLLEGHTAQRFDHDYGYDLLIVTYDEHGYVEPAGILVQLKAAEKLQSVGTDYVYDLDVRDYNLWTLERTLVILILYDATQGRAYWLQIRRFFTEDVSRRPKKGAKTVRVRVPKTQRVNREAIARIREIKNQWKPPAGGNMP